MFFLSRLARIGQRNSAEASGKTLNDVQGRTIRCECQAVSEVERFPIPQFAP